MPSIPSCRLTVLAALAVGWRSTPVDSVGSPSSVPSPSPPAAPCEGADREASGIQGRVVDSDGNPLNDILVILETGSFAGDTRTGDDGEFQTSGVTGKFTISTTDIDSPGGDAEVTRRVRRDGGCRARPGRRSAAEACRGADDRHRAPAPAALADVRPGAVRRDERRRRGRKAPSGCARASARTTSWIVPRRTGLITAGGSGPLRCRAPPCSSATSTSGRAGPPPGRAGRRGRLAACPGVLGHGYATEAAETLRFGFEVVGLDEIVSFTVPQNAPVAGGDGAHRPRPRREGDFDHPRVDAVAYPHLVRHVFYRLDREAAGRRAGRSAESPPPAKGAGIHPQLAVLFAAAAVLLGSPRGACAALMG